MGNNIRKMKPEHATKETKITFINPVGTEIFNRSTKEMLEKIKEPGAQISVVSLSRGPLHLEYRYYEALVVPEILHLIKQAEKEGYDGAVIGCFYDPGLLEAREITEKIIVTAPGEASMHIASTLGRKFSIIVGRNKWIPQILDQVVAYGFEDNLASVKAVGLGVYDFHKKKNVAIKKIKEIAREAIEKDMAEVIILGCTATFGFYKNLQKELGVPVIDPVIAALKYAEFLVKLKHMFGWKHSKKYEYETPPLVEIKDWRLEEQYGIDLWG